MTVREESNKLPKNIYLHHYITTPAWWKITGKV